MRRGSWLRRLTPLRAASSRTRRTPLSTSVRSVTPEERRARRLVRDRSGGWCERCGKAPATDWSHRKRRSQGGAWCPSNGLHACRPCHQYIDDPCNASATGMGWHVPSWRDPAAVPVYLWRHGWALLRPDGSVVPCAPPTTPDGAA